jgi:AsmA protein
METLTGKGRIIIDSAQIKGTQVFGHVGRMTGKNAFSDPRVKGIVMETEIKGGQVLMKPFSFQIGKYMTELEGSYSFKNTLSYVLRISVPPLNRIKIPFHISGTSDKPIIKLGKGHERHDFSDF